MAAGTCPSESMQQVHALAAWDMKPAWACLPAYLGARPAAAPAEATVAGPPAMSAAAAAAAAAQQHMPHLTPGSGAAGPWWWGRPCQELTSPSWPHLPLPPLLPPPPPLPPLPQPGWPSPQRPCHPPPCCKNMVSGQRKQAKGSVEGRVQGKSSGSRQQGQLTPSLLAMLAANLTPGLAICLPAARPPTATPSQAAQPPPPLLPPQPSPSLPPSSYSTQTHSTQTHSQLLAGTLAWLPATVLGTPARRRVFRDESAVLVLPTSFTTSNSCASGSRPHLWSSSNSVSSQGSATPASSNAPASAKVGGPTAAAAAARPSPSPTGCCGCSCWPRRGFAHATSARACRAQRSACSGLTPRGRRVSGLAQHSSRQQCLAMATWCLD